MARNCYKVFKTGEVILDTKVGGKIPTGQIRVRLAKGLPPQWDSVWTEVMALTEYEQRLQKEFVKLVHRMEDVGNAQGSIRDQV